MTGIRLVCITDEYSSLNPGVTTALNGLLVEASRHPEEFSDIKLISTGTDDYANVPDRIEHIELPYSKKSKIRKVWRCPANFSRKFIDIVKSCNISHIHGIWMGPHYYAARLCLKHNIPFVLTAHGMLKPWHWQDKGVLGYCKKRFYWIAVVYPVFRKATVIHAITPLERDNLRILFPDNRIEVIPNALDTHQMEIELNHLEPQAPEPIILFLGRIHPIKGIDLLIRAFVLANLPSKWKLVIAGPEDVSGYARKLKEFIVAHGLSKKVDFIGPLYGKEKLKMYKRAWIVAVPSHSEVVGMVNLEAAACCTPSITTHETGLRDWEEGGGILLDPNVEDLTVALNNAANWSYAERKSRGQNSFKLVKEKYSWEVIGRQWVSLYTNIQKVNVG